MYRLGEGGGVACEVLRANLNRANKRGGGAVTLNRADNILLNCGCFCDTVESSRSVCVCVCALITIKTIHAAHLACDQAPFSGRRHLHRAYKEKLN